MYNNAYADLVYKIKHTGEEIFIQARFDSYDITGVEELYVPERIWGTDYSQQIKNLRINRGAFHSTNYFKPSKDSQLNLVNGNYSIEYSIKNVPYDNLVNTFGNRYYHFFNNDYFFLFGLGLFILPKNLLDQKNEKVSIIIDSTVKHIISTITPYNSNIIETNIGSLDNIIIVGNERLNQLQDKNLNINIIVPHLKNK
ncbi:hypothetical protein [Rickettsia endosymbiont of Polydrusus tereticollis]|uniref:hypothetical protein n=1 Tax=Rickettsia endosymbiont of Polydrusus tereticollis TaxID=3066251 RepID=UPI0031333E5E